MSKTQNVLLAAKTVSKTQKASRCETVMTVKSPLGVASQRNGVENPKGLSLRNDSSVRPLLRSVWRLPCLYPYECVFDLLEFIYPFEFIFPFGPFLAHIFAYMYVRPFMGFQLTTCTCIPLWGFGRFEEE